MNDTTHLGDGLLPAVLWLSWTRPVALFAVLGLLVTAVATLVWLPAKFLPGLFRRRPFASPAQSKTSPAATP